MGDRKSSKELQLIRSNHNVQNLWSWSRIKLSKEDPYGYYLKYIKGEAEDQADSIYGAMGNVVHDAIEDMHEGKITRQDAIERYKDSSMELDIMGFQFNRTDEDRNESIGEKYNYSNIHFLENFTPLIGNDVRSEEFIEIKIGNQVVIGYVDHSMIDDGGDLIITDFKTSSIYMGAKILKEEGQLLLYSLGKSQSGYPIEKIKARWMFTKYVTATIDQKNGKQRVSNILRYDIGSKLSASAKSWLKECKLDKKTPMYSEIEIDAFIAQLVETNDISVLPEEVQSHFKLEDCFVYIDMTQDKLDGLVEDMRNQIFKAVKMEMDYNKTGDDTVFWSDINSENEYFFFNISGYSRAKHKCFDAYLKNKEMFLTKQDEDDIDIDDLLMELLD